MSKPDTPTPPTLADLRAEIDRIDQGMHQLLIARGEIIDTLIKVKKTQESGSAFRPAREASMMRRLVERHHGILPLDTVESIWRVIIATFTHVQAPYAVHADMSAGDAAMRDSVRFHFGFTVPFRTHLGAAGVLQAVAASKGDLGLVPASDVAGAGAWWTMLEGDKAPEDHRAAAFCRARRPPGVAARVRDFLAGGRCNREGGRGVQREGVRLERRRRARDLSARGRRRGSGRRLRRRGSPRLRAGGKDARRHHSRSG